MSLLNKCIPDLVSIVCPYFRGHKYLETYLNSVLEQTIAQDIELILDHNEPTPSEIKIVNRFKAVFPGKLVHRIVDSVEPVSKSMNNCIDNSSGEYLCIWNVDDIRVPDSLEKMRSTLQKNTNILFTYGDIIISKSFKDLSGTYVSSQDYNKSSFLRGMHLGPFFMWRANINYPIHAFDEQFRSGADFDFAIRLALMGNGKKTEGLIGYYLNEGLGASTGGKHVPANIQPIERTVIELRYGIYDKIDLRYLASAIKYYIPYVSVNQEWLELSSFYPEYNSLLKANQHLLFSIPSLRLEKSSFPLKKIVSRALRRIKLINS